MAVVTEQRGYSKLEPVLDVVEFKKRFLHGVDLRDGDGVALDDSVIQSYLDVGIDYLEHQLEAPVVPQDFEEHLDYKWQDYKQFVYLQLTRYPLVEVSEVKLVYSNRVVINFPEEWFKIYGKSGQIQLLPTYGTFNRLIFTSSGQISPGLLYGKYAPQLLHVKGKYGLGNSDHEVQPIINQAIGLYSAIFILQFLGDIGPSGPGISSSSLSMDGLSQSLSTAISATNNLYGATILKYGEMLNKHVEPLLKTRYKRIKTVFI